MKTIRLFLCSMLTLLIAAYSNAQQPTAVASSTIFYMDKPAASWFEAIPIGNGSLGGMVYGGVTNDTLQLNDDTFWSGEPRNLQRPGNYECLTEIRKMIAEDRTADAEKRINETMLGTWNECYLPLAHILIQWDGKERSDFSNYRRELDMNRGVVTISYTRDGVNYQREIFASYPDQSIVMHVTADKKQSISLAATLSSPIQHRTAVRGDRVVIKGQAPAHVDSHHKGPGSAATYIKDKGTRFEGQLLIRQKGGTISAGDTTLTVEQATEVTLIFAEATSFNGFNKDPFKEGKDENSICESRMRQAAQKSYKDLYGAHMKDYAALFGRVSIDLGSTPEAEQPINRRIDQYRTGSDPALTALYFQFGRYLMISDSRPGTIPANLQGIWNKDVQPAWSSNWTLNCNAEINYWAAEPANLSECHQPMFDMIREASVDGAKTARNLYNSKGWMAHHNLDLWRTTWPVDGTGMWAIFQTGGAWLTNHLWEHYLFTGDSDFIKKNYDLLKGATQFFLDNLQYDRDSCLVTNPAESFENQYVKPDGTIGWACMGPAQDMQIIRALFEHTMSAADIVGDPEFKSKVAAAYARLAPMKISPRTGRLQEWNDDWDAALPTNGQMGHGWAFAVGNQITLRGTPELAAAFRKSVEYGRPGYSYNSGSWTGTFPLIYWDRFEEADSVQRIIDRHFDQALSPNLTCQFMGSWQIDGNMGITAGITEMLLQSHAGEINLLPALPSKYPDGFVKGLKARGNCEVSIYWERGQLQKAVIKSIKGGSLTLRYHDKTRSYTLHAGESVTVDGELKSL